MMLPVAAAGMLCKRAVTPVVTHFGYRKVLVWNTVLCGLCMASFALISVHQPLWLRIVQLALFGAVNSLQYSAMNTLTLKDLQSSGASSGNSLFSLVQMLSMSLGVTIAGVLLATFTVWLGAGAVQASALPAFHATFISVGLITTASAWIFAQLAPDVRPSGRQHESAEI
jgi:MFS family permease